MVFVACVDYWCDFYVCSVSLSVACDLLPSSIDSNILCVLRVFVCCVCSLLTVLIDCLFSLCALCVCPLRVICCFSW